jgi:hypothetical protein
MTKVKLLALDTSRSNVLLAPPIGLHLGEAVSYLNRLVKEPASLALVRPLMKWQSEG